MREWLRRMGILGLLGASGCGRDIMEKGGKSAPETSVPSIEADGGTADAGEPPDATSADGGVIRILSVERYDPGSATRYSNSGPGIIDIEKGGGTQ